MGKWVVIFDAEIHVEVEAADEDEAIGIATGEWTWRDVEMGDVTDVYPPGEEE